MGIAGGYNGSVYEISYNSGKSYIGVCLDFSEHEIPIGIIESISFKVLMPTSYSELRMRNGNTTDWIMRNASAPTGEWNTVSISNTGSGFYGASSMNTLANSRTSFTALKGNPLNILNIPLKAGMSIGVLLVSVELIMMLVILLFV